MSQELISPTVRFRVRALGALLGQTMAAQHGESFLAKVEAIRIEARTRRQQQGRPAFMEVLHALDENAMIGVARAFNQFLNLANIAEQSETTSGAFTAFPQESHLAELFGRLVETRTKDEIFEAVRDAYCDLVLTAHPTEITRRTLIQKYNRIAETLEQLHEDAPLPDDDQTELERLIAEVWYTDEIRTERPTPQDEAIWGYAVIEHSFWDAVPHLWRGLDKLLRDNTGHPLPLGSAPIRLSSWMGGDRDGNPNVTAVVTEEVMRLARWMAADLYLRDIDELLAQLSMSLCSPALADMAGNATSEPYRVVLRNVRQRLEATREWAETSDSPGPEVILERGVLEAPLRACYDSLHESGMGIIADGLLKTTLIRVASFGVTLVNLDVRQNSDRHEDLMGAITSFLELGDYRDWSEKARQDFLATELGTRRPLIPDDLTLNDEQQETLDTFRLVAHDNGEGISAYVISMARKPSDVLAVMLLLRKCGLTREVPVVPLFETLTDLENAAWTLERLLRLPIYLEAAGRRQMVMIGYSDSAKDAGQMAASWAQYRAQEELVAVAAKYGLDLTLFHGRGGTVGRGGAPAREAILSQAGGSVSGRFRVTEQGEVIRFKYGSRPLALTNLDMVLAATIEATLLPPPAPRENWRLMMDQLSRDAMTDYRAITGETAEFVEYFAESTPERELARLAIGSRPARRSGNTRSLADLRAIPWVFAWTQKRLMLPAWLGTDVALADLSQRERNVIREMINEWPFFQTQLDSLEMVLAKTDADIAEHYDNVLVEPGLQAFGARLRDKLGSLIDTLNELKEQQSLLSGAPQIRRSLDLRDPYTDPLHLLQVELLERCRRDTDDNPDLNKALLVTIAGIAASMRNTG